MQLKNLIETSIGIRSCLTFFEVEALCIPLRDFEGYLMKRIIEAVPLANFHFAATVPC